MTSCITDWNSAARRNRLPAVGSLRRDGPGQLASARTTPFVSTQPRPSWNAKLAVAGIW